MESGRVRIGLGPGYTARRLPHGPHVNFRGCSAPHRATSPGRHRNNVFLGCPFCCHPARCGLLPTHPTCAPTDTDSRRGVTAAGSHSSWRPEGPLPRLPRTPVPLGSNGCPFLSSLLTPHRRTNRTPGCKDTDDPVGVGAPPPQTMEPISLSWPWWFSVARCGRATARGGGLLHRRVHIGATPLEPRAANPWRPRLPLGKPPRHAGLQPTTPQSCQTRGAGPEHAPSPEPVAFPKEGTTLVRAVGPGVSAAGSSPNRPAPKGQRSWAWSCFWGASRRPRRSLGSVLGPPARPRWLLL